MDVKAAETVKPAFDSCPWVAPSMEELWVDVPVRDELDAPIPEKSFAMATDELTSEKESELPGQKRPAKGAQRGSERP